ncbi:MULTISPECIES: sigma-70 family RNA polymerase sigma factor [unclassified Anaeromyxobacter]|uniref:sigma-70 family RNA polymerase sigma factor n=1 Tax=unclassified Anaeromyxobacter TaxID=2620896 RepID=UPI001F579F42|nr:MULTISPECIES: sigma-70 family RNA polymerase sigma factor [unclassified Anaeromyxobacter]
MDPKDTELLERAREGDRRALEALLSRHQRSVYRFGLKMCRDEEDAKDVLQETLLAVARNVKDFRGASSVSTWLYTIARSFCIKKRRRSKFAPEQEESLEARVSGEAARQVVDPTRPPDDALAGRQIEAALEQAIAALDPMYREVLVLRDVEGLTAPEVAEVMGLSVEAVKSRLHRARVAVREAVAPLLGIPGAAAPPAAAGKAAPGEPAAEPCPDIVELFSKHLEGEISATLCADMERHLARCPSCDARCQSLQRTLALCKAAPHPEVPAAVQASVRSALEEFLSLQRP